MRPAATEVREEQERYRAARDLGRRAEDEAARYLAERGMRLVARSFRARGGEIDLVVEDGETLVFVEVKARASLSWGRPSEAVGPVKRARMERAARLFLARRAGRPEPPCRFDVVEVLARPGEPLRIRHLPDAFGIDG
ncbi:MAG TPA: YraN family protein [Candidatus Polarisedimenticolia bacterium]|nr:YraN family protein [Candidatus Polarisedimenticolia bacterium]